MAGIKFDAVSLKCYIDSNFQNPYLNVDFISREFGISLSYMSRSFKKQYDIGMAEYILKCRLNKAKHYLHNTDYNILKIADMSGFSSVYVFIRSFKRYEGVTPNYYRVLNNKHFGDDKMIDIKKRLIPYPAKLTDNGGTVKLGPVSKVDYVIEYDAQSACEAANLIIESFKKTAFSACGDLGYKIKLSVCPSDDIFKDINKCGAYYIDIGKQGAVVKGYDESGLYYGAVSFSKLLYSENNGVYLPEYQILDYPYYEKRGHFFECRYGSDFMTLDDWKNAIDYLSQMKINYIVIGLYGCWSRQYDGVFAEYQYVPLKSYPNLNTPRDIKYYSAKNQSFVYEQSVLPVIYREDYFGELIAYAKKKFVHIVPLFNSLGHNTLIPRMFPQISAVDENGEYSKVGFCTNNPKTYEIMFDIYDEIIDKYLKVNDANSFEIGMDEIWPVMGVDKNNIYEERSPFCKCEKCRSKTHIELMTDYIIKLCHHLKSKGIKDIYIYHDMLFENNLLNEDFADRLKSEGIYENIIIDWWSYVGSENLFRGNADKVNSVFRSIGKPMTGYYHWNIPSQANDNIYAMTETIMKHKFEGMIAYGSFEYCYDYNYNLLAQCAWNPSYELECRDTLLRYANMAFPKDADRAYDALKLVQDLTNGPNTRADNYLEVFFEYYYNCYLNKDNEYPQDYPAKQFRAIRDDEKKYLGYLEENVHKSKELYEYFSNCTSSKKSEIWKLICATRYTLANEFYVIYTKVKNYHNGKIDENELLKELYTLLDIRDNTIALLENTRITANVYTAARNMTVNRQFITDLINNIKSDMKNGVKPRADIFNFKDFLSDMSVFLR